jgi:hypothetical protein
VTAPIQALTLSYPFYLQGGGCNREIVFHGLLLLVVAVNEEMFQQRALVQKMSP